MIKMMVHMLGALPALQVVGASLLSGVVGTMILTGFFITIMSVELLAMLLPVVVAFNAAISGYMLIDRGGEAIHRPHVISATVGIGVAMVSFIAINSICFHMGGFVLMSGTQALVAGGMAVVGAWCAGVLAVKYHQLQEQAAATEQG